jgi:transposase
LFPDEILWAGIGLFLARRGGSADAIRAAGVPGVTAWLRAEKLRFQARTVEKVVTWSGNAAEADPLASHLTRVWHALHDDWHQKTELIRHWERELAEILVKTPYLLLLSHPGINVISASDLAAEMGPIEHYAQARAITGRAGIFPARYQSDEVDHTGSLAHHRNSRLRAAWLRVADCLLKC